MALTPEQYALVEAHEPLLHVMARIHNGRGMDYGDLLGYGAIGLIKAACTYQEGRGASFATYARDSISWAMLDGLRRERHTRRSAQQGAISLDSLPNPEGLLSEPDHADAVCDGLLFEPLRAAVQMLPLRHRLVVHGYYLDGMRDGALAALLGVGDSRIGQIRREGLAMLRRLLLLAGTHKGADLGGWQWDSEPSGATASPQEAGSA